MKIKTKIIRRNHISSGAPAHGKDYKQKERVLQPGTTSRTSPTTNE